MTMSAAAEPVVVVVGPGEGEVVGDAPDRRVEILCDDDALHATWSRFAAGRDGADLHVHRRHTDLFYVLEGELTVRLGPQGDGVTVPAGTLARIPPLIVHGFRNASDADVRYLNLHAPGRGFADYMRALRDGRECPYDQHPPPPDGGCGAADAVFAQDGPEADEPGMRAVLLADVEEITVARVELEPGTSPPPHAPGRTTWFYVLRGELAITAKDVKLRAASGTWARIPAGVAHSLFTAGPEPARFLALHAAGAGTHP
jgi:quercetin dioxygenase-like cupin family protein